MSDVKKSIIPWLRICKFYITQNVSKSKINEKINIKKCLRNIYDTLMKVVVVTYKSVKENFRLRITLETVVIE